MIANQTEALATAIAGGAIIAALLDALVAKGVLTTSEASDVCGNAQGRLQGITSLPEGIEAARICSRLYTAFENR